MPVVVRLNANRRQGRGPLYILPNLLLCSEPIVEGMLADKIALLGKVVGGFRDHAMPLRLLRRVKRA